MPWICAIRWQIKTIDLKETNCLPCNNLYCRHLLTFQNPQFSPISFHQLDNSEWQGHDAQSVVMPSKPCQLQSAGQYATSVTGSAQLDDYLQPSEQRQVHVPCIEYMKIQADPVIHFLKIRGRWKRTTKTHIYRAILSTISKWLNIANKPYTGKLARYASAFQSYVDVSGDTLIMRHIGATIVCSKRVLHCQHKRGVGGG